MGVGDAFGALVTRTKGNDDAEAGATPQEVSNSANRKMNLRLDDFMRGWQTVMERVLWRYCWKGGDRSG